MVTGGRRSNSVFAGQTLGSDRRPVQQKAVLGRPGERNGEGTAAERAAIRELRLIGSVGAAGLIGGDAKRIAEPVKLAWSGAQGNGADNRLQDEHAGCGKRNPRASFPRPQ
jgi:hypothetical protein